MVWRVPLGVVTITGMSWTWSPSSASASQSGACIIKADTGRRRPASLSEVLGEVRALVGEGRDLAGVRLLLAGLQKEVAVVLALSTELKEKPDASEREERELEREWPLPTERRLESVEVVEGLRLISAGIMSLGSVILERRGTLGN